ncbi:bacillithiol biosynthesis cysteine-adding enzyme BshC [Oceanobacillus manasiensis]|uniref:bacillithiol biosynthesis cysteine-adding enzyme BshC n=1 Tax=Oceanobacillus manasiensis TaxID=586413 RepID=UPI0005AACDFA|nr:bacillithiol biosynthesis cysteine-adding enzyme BshC [Oceanobacillus manasiensis]
MQVEAVQIHKENKLLQDYRNNDPNIMQFFQYHPYDDFKQRLSELKDRSFDRDKLSQLLNDMNSKWGVPESSIANIARLKQKESVVVVGGQQAGILTGPMYTINKIISIIQLAKQQEEVLDIPVIPVFWIAGEDHDFAEINHIFVPEMPKMKKFKLFQQALGKQSVSDIELEKEGAESWVNQLFEQLEETSNTKDLHKTILSCLDLAKSYVDFFARLVYKLFPNEGLVLINSSDKALRELEGKHFDSLIKVQPEISKEVFKTSKEINHLGYSISLELDKEDGHLFYHDGGERILLVKDKEGTWSGKQNEIKLTTQELRQIAMEQPYNLSNNVVTRPIMQDLVLPTLAFIGGPGEIGYWSVLKPAFDAMQIKMPPVLPRLSFTFVERSVEKALMKYNINVENAVNNGVEVMKQEWLDNKQNPPIDSLSEEIRQKITEVHKPLREMAKEMRPDLGDLADKNLQYLQDTVHFLEKRLKKAVEEKYAREIAEFDLITMSLKPDGSFQERIWNPIFWLNNHGIKFIEVLTNENLSIKTPHYVVRL